MNKEIENILSFLCSELKSVIEGVFYNDTTFNNELCVYVIVREHFNRFYEKILLTEGKINQTYKTPVTIHVWASQGRTIEKCRPPSTKQWVSK
ncbi:MAG: hypothetical protein WC444_05035 [Candidatus Paceibacterota bacterium]